VVAFAALDQEIALAVATNNSWNAVSGTIIGERSPPSREVEPLGLKRL
jgi:hypothetical protein